MQCFNNKDLVKILYMTNGIGGLNGSRDSKLRLKALDFCCWRPYAKQAQKHLKTLY